MKKLSIIHTLPIDYYPPAVNLINSLDELANISVITTRAAIGSRILTTEGNVKVYYGFNEVRRGNSIMNLIKHLWFVIYAICKLIKEQPDIILYYESISSFPAYLYKRYINKNITVCSHYHEYMTKTEYKRPGMRIWNIYRHFEESWLFKHCNWISHTNSYRLDLFKNDYPFLNSTQCHVMPNYPPKKWITKHKNLSKNGVIRCIYVGSLSLSDMFVKEFVEWANTMNGRISIDFYAFNFHPDIISYFDKLNKPWINLYSHGVNYFDIPELLSRYDVGLLLYKAKTLNYKYNETNKLYEYLACGLNVWYPSTMLLIQNMASRNLFINNRCKSFDSKKENWPNLSDITSVDNTEYDYYCERIYKSFLSQASNK